MMNTLGPDHKVRRPGVKGVDTLFLLLHRLECLNTTPNTFQEFLTPCIIRQVFTVMYNSITHIDPVTMTMMVCDLLREEGKVLD